MRHRKITAALMIGGLSLVPVTTNRAWAHCDGLDGPVVKAAEKALATNNVNLILIWVDRSSEPELRSVFQRVVSSRQTSAEARALADRYLFETLVRLHRAGEGAPYTGLKPAGRDLGPAIPAADRAIESGDPNAIEELLVKELRAALHKSFEQVTHSSRYNPNDVEAGRNYVKAYVEYIHFVERLHEAATASAGGHYAETDSH